MKKIAASEQRSVIGGKSVKCPFCGRTFKDRKLLGLLKITDGQTEYAQHLSIWGGCMYSKSR